MKPDSGSMSLSEQLLWSVDHQVETASESGALRVNLRDQERAWQPCGVCVHKPPFSDRCQENYVLAHVVDRKSINIDFVSLICVVVGDGDARSQVGSDT